MFDTITFKKFSGEKIPDVESYVKTYVNAHPDVEILVGTDSQNRGDVTVYSTVIAMYNPGNGAHCVFKRWKTQRVRDMETRLLTEVSASIECAENLVAKGIKKPKYIDIDINPNQGNRSNSVFASAKGMVTGMGYDVRFKTFGPLVTTVADWIVKK